MDSHGLKARWAEILQELAGLAEMRRGSVVEQFQDRILPSGEKIRRGPYPLYSYKEKGRTFSRRLKTPEETSRYRKHIENFRRFGELVRELILIGEQLCEIGRGDVKKKPPKPPSKPTGKSKD